MAWLSTSIIISRILRLESKSFLCNQAATLSILYNSVKSSTFHQNAVITNFLLPSFPFSTEPKKYQSTTEGKKNITKSLKLPSEHKRRVYTKEEDELILEKVQRLGKDNPETWKSLAKDLDVEKSHDIRRQYDSITSRDTKEIKRFTEEDDQLILSYVSKNGQSASTWRELAKILYTKHPTNFQICRRIKLRHELLVTGVVKGINKEIVKGAFTKKEDRIILKEVEKAGNSVETFIALAKKLNRPYYQNIRARLEHLQNKPSRERGGWTLEDDRVFLEEIFQVRQCCKCLGKKVKPYLFKSKFHGGFYSYFFLLG